MLEQHSAATRLQAVHRGKSGRSEIAQRQQQLVQRGALQPLAPPPPIEPPSWLDTLPTSEYVAAGIGLPAQSVDAATEDGAEGGRRFAQVLSPPSPSTEVEMQLASQQSAATRLQSRQRGKLGRQRSHKVREERLRAQQQMEFVQQQQQQWEEEQQLLLASQPQPHSPEPSSPVQPGDGGDDADTPTAVQPTSAEPSSPGADGAIGVPSPEELEGAATRLQSRQRGKLGRQRTRGILEAGARDSPVKRQHHEDVQDASPPASPEPSTVLDAASPTDATDDGAGHDAGAASSSMPLDAFAESPFSDISDASPGAEMLHERAQPPEDPSALSVSLFEASNASLPASLPDSLPDYAAIDGVTDAPMDWEAALRSEPADVAALLASQARV